MNSPRMPPARMNKPPIRERTKGVTGRDSELSPPHGKVPRLHPILQDANRFVLEGIWSCLDATFAGSRYSIFKSLTERAAFSGGARGTALSYWSVGHSTWKAAASGVRVGRKRRFREWVGSGR